MDADILSAAPKMSAVRPSRLAEHQETDHRVSNSLQLVTAMLSMQAREASDERVHDALLAAARRVAAVGAIHRQLSRASADRAIDIAAYLHELGLSLQEGLGSGPGHRRVRIHAQPCEVHPAFATVLGILVSELVMNAFKHAYGANEPGEVDVCLFFAGPSRFVLEVRDYGRASGTGAPGAETAGIGTHLIQAISRRLGATYVFDREVEGARVTLSGLVRPGLA